MHVDQRGLVWVNLDANEIPITPWNEDFLGADTQKRLMDFDMTEYAFDHTWDMQGDYNWKTLVDNYNEVRGHDIILQCSTSMCLSLTRASRYLIVLSLRRCASWNCRYI